MKSNFLSILLLSALLIVVSEGRPKKISMTQNNEQSQQVNAKTRSKSKTTTAVPEEEGEEGIDPTGDLAQAPTNLANQAGIGAFVKPFISQETTTQLEEEVKEKTEEEGEDSHEVAKAGQGEQAQGKEQKVVLASGKGTIAIAQRDGQSQSAKGAMRERVKGEKVGKEKKDKSLKQKQKQSQKIEIE